MEGGASRVTPSVAIDDKEPVQVVADPPSEFSWKREALQFAAKRAKLFGDKFAWEQSTVSVGCLGSTTSFQALWHLDTRVLWHLHRLGCTKFCNRKLYLLMATALHQQKAPQWKDLSLGGHAGKLQTKT